MFVEGTFEVEQGLAFEVGWIENLVFFDAVASGISTLNIVAGKLSASLLWGH